MFGLILLIALMLIVFGIYIGLICLQVYISKNNKRGKFAIPIILFVIPFVIIVLGMAAFTVIRTSPSTTISEEEILSEEEYSERDAETEDKTATTIGFALGNVIVLPAFLSFPCAIITLIIELVYRAKRDKRISAEEIIDIQNL